MGHVPRNTEWIDVRHDFPCDSGHNRETSRCAGRISSKSVREPRSRGWKNSAGKVPLTNPLDETLLRRNNRQLSSSPVFIINDGLPRSKSSRQNSLSFEKFPSNTAAILSWSRRDLTVRLVPSLLSLLHCKIVRGERNRGKKKEREREASREGTILWEKSD